MPAIFRHTTSAVLAACLFAAPAWAATEHAYIGIYTADPVVVKDATMFDTITYMDVLRLGLRVMDATAIALCRENNLPIVIFNLNQRGNIGRVVMGEKIGSLVNEG